jgi:hypothetical protein
LPCGNSKLIKLSSILKQNFLKTLKSVEKKLSEPGNIKPLLLTTVSRNENGFILKLERF